ncbi:MAG: diacylglycerol/lipid kinase family protein [Luteibaculaceae bacterium]
MDNKLNVLFVLNPISGHGLSASVLRKKIESNLNLADFNWELKLTGGIRDAYFIAEYAVSQEYFAVVAVGGDGTVNEVASALLNTDTKLGIIPVGSGNGVARHFCIPLDIDTAIQHLNNKKSALIDTFTLNEFVGVGFCGFGFDAAVAHAFTKVKTRGLLQYIKQCILGYRSFTEEHYTLKVDGSLVFQDKAFIVAVCNTSQYGNNALISPESSAEDGFLEVVVVKPLPIGALPLFLMKFFNGTLNKHNRVTVFKGKTIELGKENAAIHLDGEARFLSETNTAVVEVKPKSLNILL